MYYCVNSAALIGIECVYVKVEADVSAGLPCFEMVGMLSGEVKEAKERVRVALKNNQIILPPQRITVNLSPANIRKSGTTFDLPIAIAILKCVGEIDTEDLDEMFFIGELGLNGELMFAKGILPAVLKAREHGIRVCIVPKENEEEASVVEGVEIYGMESLSQVIEFLRFRHDERKAVYKPKATKSFDNNENDSEEKERTPDFCEISGQTGMKRAAEVAAAGFHHLLMVGSPGSGKTMIAKRIPYIMPLLTHEECLEVSKIYSVAGKLNKEQYMITKRPFCSPHHTVTERAMSGGGTIPRPGVLSLSHKGILFLDEAVHFNTASIEVLRQPLEDKKIEISRNYGTFVFPADFMLVAAINPCPCGYYPDRNRCNCTPWQIKRYLSKISGPILDRIDLCVDAPRMDLKDLENGKKEETSEEIRKRVMKARNMQLERFKGSGIIFNSQMGPEDIKKYCILGRKEHRFMEEVFQQMQLSARSYHKILRVARTIADLSESEEITVMHLAEAVNYRTNGKLAE